MNYTFVRINKDHLPLIIALYKEVFKSKITFEELSSIFNTEIFGKYTIGYLAVADNGETAGYYGVFPMKASINGKTHLVAQSGATMTSVNHQKKGLFTKLAQLTYEAAKNEGVKLIFGFPNENSYPGFKNKLNWIFEENLCKVEIKYFNIPICEISSKIGFVRSLYLAYLKKRLQSYIIDSNQVVFDNEFIIKDSEFLKYKLVRENIWLVEVKGFKILLKAGPHLLIGAVEEFNDDRIEEFSKTLKNLAALFFARKVVFQLSNNHWLLSMLRDQKIRESLPVGYFALIDGLELNNLTISFADFDTF